MRDIAVLGNPVSASQLDISQVDDGYVIYQPDQDRVHYLNATAVLVLELCTGENPIPEIVTLVQQAYNLPKPPEREVLDVLSKLKEEGLLLS